MQAVEFPREALELGIEGRVVASFVVEPRRHGVVGADYPVARPDPLAGGGAGVGRVAQMDPRQQGRRAVRVKYTLPVDFRVPVKPAATHKPKFGPSSGGYTPRP